MKFLLKIIILIFVCFCTPLYTQNYKEYIHKNKLYFNQENDTNVLIKLLDYDYFFLGEKHYETNIDSIRSTFVDFLIKRKKINFLFLEEGVNSYDDFEMFSQSPKEKRCCQDFIWDMSYYRKVLKGINDFNLAHSKIMVLPIDVFHSMDHYRGYDITRFLGLKKSLPDFIYKEAKQIYNVSKKKRERSFKAFTDSFYLHQIIYEEFLGKNYKKVKKVVDAFDINYRTIRINPDSAINTLREDFMFQNILSEIDITSSFISLNGLAHVGFVHDNEPIVTYKGWESLAYKFQINFPLKKTCSIFILNRKEDSMQFYFNEEEAELLKNIPEGEIILMALNGENSPFKKMQQLFTYVLVY